MNYSGVDLHSNNSVVTVIDDTDRVVAEKRQPNDLTKILAILTPSHTELPRGRVIQLVPARRRAAGRGPERASG